MPHKEKAAAVVDVASPAVRRTGACNTFWGGEDGRVHGDNTDVDGFRAALKVFVEGSPTGIRALLLGAGGAARAALVGQRAYTVAAAHAPAARVWRETGNARSCAAVAAGQDR